MKGLIRNNFYAMEGNIKLSLAIAGCLSLAVLFVRNSAVIQVVISMQVFIFVANVCTSLQADEVSRWNKFERMLPVQYSTIIGAKYISFLLLILLGMVMGGVTTALMAAVEGTVDVQAVLYGYTFGLSLSAATAGIMYPLTLKLGTEKSELIMILSAIGSIGMISLVAAVLSPLIGEMNMRLQLVRVAAMLVAFAVFAGSYGVSVRIFRRKTNY